MLSSNLFLNIDWNQTWGTYTNNKVLIGTQARLIVILSWPSVTSVAMDRSSNRFHLDNPRYRNSTGGNVNAINRQLYLHNRLERAEESRGEEEILAAENVKVEEPWREFGRSSEEAVHELNFVRVKDFESLEFHFQTCSEESYVGRILSIDFIF